MVSRGRIAQCVFLEDGDVDAIAVAVGAPVEGDDELQPRAGAVDASARYGIDLAELAERASFTGAAGTSHTVDLPRSHGRAVGPLPWSDLPHRIIFVGTGHGSAQDLRRAGAALARATVGLGRVVTTVAAGTQTETARGFVEGYLLGAYRQPALSRSGAGPRPAHQLVLLGSTPESVVEAASRSAWATWLVRDLTSVPSNIKTPEWFTRRVTELADAEGLELSVRGPEELTAEGFGGLLAVGSGSVDGPRLVTVTYTPFEEEPARGSKHVVVVGKGITFDTGGLSIKPREAMIPMKTDMAGAAVALAVVVGASRARSKHRVTAVLPLAENHFGASSYRPGDVLTLRGGTTVEVANTDAEGRLVLADAMAYADDSLDPDILIDVATLTGAASQGLGRGHGALYSADERLLAGFEAAAQVSGEKVWHMPLVEEYRSALRSTVADLRHVPIDAPGGGSITAALFLREFAGERRWVHLDIAGPARSTTTAHEVPKGATGYGARLVLRFLEKLR
ncbi:leucyl aminopeptidase family protein [Sanguibacter antarcticus]|uniref:Probable cytosol aminopeptidase n=1 Tax=Sanguibacter antarcticus TaxID=372484 RepID=A0A2A9E5B3_9MICO|nr:leucyl aminopeptidase family protein [Sanguibacter antarcticus]PFG33741.1 leucyl aminopeptidase [Sanguibacter antarcticus]